MKTGKKGFTLVEVMIVMLIISLVTAVTVPRVMKIRDRTVSEISAAHLKSIEDAKVMWALDQSAKSDSEPSENELAPYIQGGFPRPVVAGTLYNIGSIIKPASITPAPALMELAEENLDLTTLEELVAKGEVPVRALADDAEWEWVMDAELANADLMLDNQVIAQEALYSADGAATPKMIVKADKTEKPEEEVPAEEQLKEEEFFVSAEPEIEVNGKKWTFSYLRYRGDEGVYEGYRIFPGLKNLIARIRINIKTGVIEYFNSLKDDFEEYKENRMTFINTNTKETEYVDEDDIPERDDD